MKDMNDTRGKTSGYNDFTIPIEVCTDETKTWYTGANRLYCPKFNETHFIHGSMVAEKYSWIRLGLHLCDDREDAKLKRQEANKTHINCKSREESLRYFDS